MQALVKGGGRGRSRLIGSKLKTSWTGQDQRRCYSFARQVQVDSIKPVASLGIGHDYDGVDIQQFRTRSFDAEKPLLMPAGPMFVQSSQAMPAISKWFQFDPAGKPGFKSKNGQTISEYLRSFSDTTMLPFELTYPQRQRMSGDTVQRFIDSLAIEATSKPGPEVSPDFLNVTSAAAPVGRGLADLIKAQLPPDSYQPNTVPHPEKVLRFHAPLALLNAAINFNLHNPGSGLHKLYVAQAPLSDLPKELQDDLPVPKIVKLAGRGDIYNSSLWLGLEPTFTPLHRDPNPNLFIQLCSTKIVRLLPPASGDQLYRDVQLRLGDHRYKNSRLRGSEMMEGPERDLLRKAVWEPGGLQGEWAPKGVPTAHQGLPRTMMQEAHLQPGDALFIPKGWWHSVASVHQDGALNASVNWWFR